MFNKKFKKIINIEGMHCQHCVNRVELELKKLDGVSKVKISLENKKAILFSKEDISDDLIIQAICNLGYNVTGITNS